MTRKNIILFEKYDGVRFVLERSLEKYKQNFKIYSSYRKNEVKQILDRDNVDLLVTELSRLDPDGLEISQYARKTHPDLKIIWITVSRCKLLQDKKMELGHVRCIEKPLEISEFRKSVLKLLGV